MLNLALCHSPHISPYCLFCLSIPNTPLHGGDEFVDVAAHGLKGNLPEDTGGVTSMIALFKFIT
jgi:hypothetical protein